MLAKMTEMLHHQPFYKTDELFARHGVYASRIHKNIIQRRAQPFKKGSICVWFDGEINNCTSFGAEYNDISDAEFVCVMYQERRDFSFLKDIDGIFSAVIIDENKQKIHFITDRYGFRLLYYYQEKDLLAWASETKGMLALENFEPAINTDAAHHFIDNGYVLENESLLKGVELFPPATVATWDISQRIFTKSQRYWSWDDIKIKKPVLNEKELIEEMGRLFRKAVESRSHPSDNVGVTLSGGLDSRAILAAMPQTDHPIPTYTFGKPGCWDIDIAEKVCRTKGADHHVASLTAENWLDQRTDGVWWSDGHMNMMHMHILTLLPEMKEYFNINLNGFLGDAILGGYYLFDEQVPFQEKMNNRGRRFINEGNRLGEIFAVFYRLPFLDVKLMEFAFSLPKNLLEYSVLYNKMLLKEFPKFYESISWQRTGFSIATSELTSVMKFKLHALRNRKVKLFKKAGLAYQDHKYYHNYPEWIRHSAPFFENLLMNDKAIYPEFISRKEVHDDWKSHLQGEDLPEKICRYATLEIYMQQLFEKKYRP